MARTARCRFAHPDGRPCGAPPLKGGGYCLWHDPDESEDAAEARRLGGLRRRREKTLAGVYDFSGLGSVEDIRRLLEVAVLDALGMENSAARSRLLVTGALVAVKLLEAEAAQAFAIDDD